LNLNEEDLEWQPTVDQLRTVLGLAAAIIRDDSADIRALSRELTLQECGMACLALTQVLLDRLADATGRSLDDVVASLSAELGAFADDN
jgi:hypothetical protein